MLLAGCVGWAAGLRDSIMQVSELYMGVASKLVKDSENLIMQGFILLVRYRVVHLAVAACCC